MHTLRIRRPAAPAQPAPCRCGWCTACIGDDLSVRPLPLRTPRPSEVRAHLEALGIPTDEEDLLLRYCG